MLRTTCSRSHGTIPLPSSTDEPSIIHSLYYPHVVDVIFDHAPLAALLVMRCANKAWREKADRRIAYHLVVKGNSTPIEIHAGLLGEHFMTITEDNLKHAKELQPSWAKFVRVIDIDATSCHKEVCRLLSSWKVDESYETIRYVVGSPAFDKYSKLSKQPKRVVFLRSYAITGHFEDDSHKTMKRLIYSERFIGKPGRSGGAVIMHQEQAAAYAPENPFEHHSLLTPCFMSYPLVVILRGWNEPVTGSDVVAGNIELAFQGNLGHVFKVIKQHVRTRVPTLTISRNLDEDLITIVGMETLSLSSVGLKEGDLDGKTLQQALKDLLQQSWDEMMGYAASEEEDSNRDSESDGTDEEVGSTVSSYLSMRKTMRKQRPSLHIDFKTHEEYRASCNKSDYEIETSPVLSVRRNYWALRKPVVDRPPPRRRHSIGGEPGFCALPDNVRMPLALRFRTPERLNL